MFGIFNLIKTFNEKRSEKEKQRLTFKLCELLDQPAPDMKAMTDLLARGADPNMYVKDSGLFALTPLQRAAIGKFASLETMQILLKNGANPFLPAVTATGRSELSFSAMIKKDRPDILQCLRDAETNYEKQHGPQPALKSACGIRSKKKPRI